MLTIILAVSIIKIFPAFFLMYFLIFTFSDGGGRQSVGFYNENIAVTY